MLRLQDARRERFFGVVGEHRHGRLRDDRPVVRLFGDEMHSAAVNPQARVERAAMRVEASEVMAARQGGC